MRSLKSTTSTTTTLKGKRKLAQSKEYPESPPTTPPNGKSTTTRGKKRISEVNSPPAKRRRSSDRIANKTGQKRASMEDDDGFVFTRPSKQKRKVAEVKEVSTRPEKPFVMDFTAEVSSSLESCADETPVASSNPFQPSRQPKRTPPQTDSRMAIKDTFVALPISDTPIIRRNQDLRQQAGGRRRSSLSLRGNRTSSIGNGFEGMNWNYLTNDSIAASRCCT
jgi:kinetochore protein Mis13/DSN1